MKNLNTILSLSFLLIITSMISMQREHQLPQDLTEQSMDDTEDLPTRTEIEKRFEDYEQQIIADLLNNGYSLEKNPGVKNLPILEWKSYKTIPTELDEFKMKQIENSCSKYLKRDFKYYENQFCKNIVDVLLIRGPRGCGKTSLAKLIAYKTRRPYIIVPKIFFTSSYTAQKLDIYFDYAEGFKNGGVIILENLPDKSECHISGISKICSEIDDLKIHKKNISIIATCVNNTRLTERFRSRITDAQGLQLPNFNVCFQNLKHYLSPKKTIDRFFLEALAISLDAGTWNDINEGIEKSRNFAQSRTSNSQQPLVIQEQDINQGFEVVIQRLKNQRWNTKKEYFWSTVSIVKFLLTAPFLNSENTDSSDSDDE